MAVTWGRAGRSGIGTAGLPGAGLAVALALLAAGGCRRAEAPPGRGRRIAEGPARGLTASPDGRWLAWLDRCVQPPVRGLPADTASCDLEVAPAGGGPARRVAEGVSSLPGGFAWSPDGRALAALGAYDYGAAAGGLVLWRPAGEPERLAGVVTFYGFGPAGDLDFVAGGQLYHTPPGRSPEPVARAAAVATFERGPEGGAGAAWMLARRQAAAGAALLLLREGKVLAELPGPVGDYAFSPSGDRIAYTAREKDGFALHLADPKAPGKAALLGRRVQSFAFSRDGAAIAWVADLLPGRAGDLYLGRSTGLPAAQKLASGVGEFRWAAAGARIAWLQEFDPRVRSGALGAAEPGMRPVVLGRNVTAYDLSPDGGRVAFLEHVTAGGYSVDLKLAAVVPGASGEIVARGVFGFDFSPQGDLLYYRTGCVRNAEACDLYRLPAAADAPARRVEKIAEGIKSFEFDRRRPGRLLLTWARKDLMALDLGVWENGRMVAVDRAALPGSAAFLPPDGARLGYVVADPKRAGVYLADLPR